MRDLAHLVALLEMREEQLEIHLCSVRAQSTEARKARAQIATMRIRKRAIEEFAVHENRAPTGATVH